MRIIIIGGGIGGLLTSIALSKKGISATIYEKTKSYDPNGAGLALWANATLILNKLGLMDNFRHCSSALDTLKISTSSGRQLNEVRLKKLETKFHAPSIVLLRQDLQKGLLGSIPASEIHYNKHCIKVEQGSEKVTVYFNDGTNETADGVIFSDGVHSIARKDVFNFPPLQYAGRTSWRGVAEFSNPVFSNHTNFEIFGNGRRIGIFPLPNNLAYWYASVNMTHEEAEQQKASIDGVLSHFKHWAEPVDTLLKNTREERLILTKINHATHIGQLVKGNIALLGDAGHPMTPDLGQGACQAIEDGYVLAECLASANTISEGFKQYENLRLKRVRAIVMNSFRAGRLRQLSNPLGMAFRNNLFRFLPESMALKILESNIEMR